MEKYLKRQIIAKISKLDEMDIKFLNQMLTLINTHLKRTGRL